MRIDSSKNYELGTCTLAEVFQKMYEVGRGCSLTFCIDEIYYSISSTLQECSFDYRISMFTEHFQSAIHQKIRTEHFCPSVEELQEAINLFTIQKVHEI